MNKFIVGAIKAIGLKVPDFIRIHLLGSGAKFSSSTAYSFLGKSKYTHFEVAWLLMKFPSLCAEDFGFDSSHFHSVEQKFGIDGSAAFYFESLKHQSNISFWNEYYDVLFSSMKQAQNKLQVYDYCMGTKESVSGAEYAAVQRGFYEKLEAFVQVNSNIEYVRFLVVPYGVLPQGEKHDISTVVGTVQSLFSAETLGHVCRCLGLPNVKMYVVSPPIHMGSITTIDTRYVLTEYERQPTLNHQEGPGAYLFQHRNIDVSVKNPVSGYNKMLEGLADFEFPFSVYALSQPTFKLSLLDYVSSLTSEKSRLEAVLLEGSKELSLDQKSGAKDLLEVSTRVSELDQKLIDLQAKYEVLKVYF